MISWPPPRTSRWRTRAHRSVAERQVTGVVPRPCVVPPHVPHFPTVATAPVRVGIHHFAGGLEVPRTTGGATRRGCGTIGNGSGHYGHRCTSLAYERSTLVKRLAQDGLRHRSWTIRRWDRDTSVARKGGSCKRHESCRDTPNSRIAELDQHRSPRVRGWPRLHLVGR